MKTHVYKRRAGIDLEADVYLPRETNGPVPVVVSLHGGALIMGSRSGVDARLSEILLERGIAIVSPDYRLAPETKLPEIWRDVEDVFTWIREQGPSLFGADPQRIGVHGTSAGGYLALLAGCRIDPRPRVVGAYAGYGDITGDWYAMPSEWYRTQGMVDRDEAHSTVGQNVPVHDATGLDRGKYYLYLRQQGLWPREVSGLECDDLRAYCPTRLVTTTYPPAVLYHGKADHDVPYEQSAEFVDRLSELGVEHEFVSLNGVDHVFCGGSESDVEDVHRTTSSFLIKYLS